MKKPEIANLSSKEREELISVVKGSNLDPNRKEIIVDTIDSFNSLLEKLKSSKISIHQLKQLFGFRSEQLKKLMQTR